MLLATALPAPSSKAPSKKKKKKKDKQVEATAAAKAAAIEGAGGGEEQGRGALGEDGEAVRVLLGPLAQLPREVQQQGLDLMVQLPEVQLVVLRAVLLALQVQSQAVQVTLAGNPQQAVRLPLAGDPQQQLQQQGDRAAEGYPQDAVLGLLESLLIVAPQRIQAEAYAAFVGNILAGPQQPYVLAGQDGSSTAGNPGGTVGVQRSSKESEVAVGVDRASAAAEAWRAVGNDAAAAVDGGGGGSGGQGGVLTKGQKMLTIVCQQLQRYGPLQELLEQLLPPLLREWQQEQLLCTAGAAAGSSSRSRRSEHICYSLLNLAALAAGCWVPPGSKSLAAAATGASSSNGESVLLSSSPAAEMAGAESGSVVVGDGGVGSTNSINSKSSSSSSSRHDELLPQHLLEFLPEVMASHCWACRGPCSLSSSSNGAGTTCCNDHSSGKGKGAGDAVGQSVQGGICGVLEGGVEPATAAAARVVDLLAVAPGAFLERFMGKMGLGEEGGSLGAEEGGAGAVNGKKAQEGSEGGIRVCGHCCLHVLLVFEVLLKSRSLLGWQLEHKAECQGLVARVLQQGEVLVGAGEVEGKEVVQVAQRLGTALAHHQL
jgi:hypothetical protein